MASLMGTYAKEAIANGTLIWSSADIRIALSTGFAFNVDTDRYLSAMTSECTGASYSRKTLSGKTVTRVTGGIQLKGDTMTWTAANFGTPAVAVVYVYNASDASALIVGVLDQNDLPTNTGDYALEWSGDPTNGALFAM